MSTPSDQRDTVDKGPQQKRGLHQKPSTPKQELGSRSNLATSVVTTSTWEASVRVASSSEDTGQGDAQLPPLLPETRSRSRSASSSPGHRRHGPRPLSVLTRTTTNTSVADSLLHQNPILKEHEPLTTLLGLIPAKAQKGMFSECELQLTCIAANGDYLALGTNVGLVFMYNRKKRCLDRLRCDSNEELVTCVQLQHGINYQVAIGTSMGGLYMFNIPSNIITKNQVPQRFSVQDVHSTPLTCLEWSPNGMKLFSGDQKGVVVGTEVDFQKGRCESSVLLTEFLSEIVQLGYFQRALLVSTSMRALICRTDRNNEIIQVGQKKRKAPGNYGTCFLPMLCKLSDAQLYAARPGQRIWMSNIEGTVQATHIFKHLMADSTEIPLLLYETSNFGDEPSSSDQQFGILCPYGDSNQIVTWNKRALYILDPEKNVVIGKQERMGHIVDVAVDSKEIFVLTRSPSRTVIRISPQPESQKYRGVSSVNINAANSAGNEDEYRNRSNSPIRFLPANIFGIIRPKESKYTPLIIPGIPRMSSEPKISESYSSRDGSNRIGRSSSSSSSSNEDVSCSLSNSFGSVPTNLPASSLPKSDSKNFLPPLITLPSDDVIQLELYTHPLETEAKHHSHMLEDEICRGVAATEDFIGPEALSSSETVSDLTSCLKSNTYKSTDSAGMTKSAMGSTKELSSKINNRKPVVHRRSYIDKVNVIDNSDDIVFKSRTKKKKHKAVSKSKEPISGSEVPIQPSESYSVDSPEVTSSPGSSKSDSDSISSNSPLRPTSKTPLSSSKSTPTLQCSKPEKIDRPCSIVNHIKVEHTSDITDDHDVTNTVDGISNNVDELPGMSEGPPLERKQGEGADSPEPARTSTVESVADDTKLESPPEFDPGTLLANNGPDLSRNLYRDDVWKVTDTIYKRKSSAPSTSSVFPPKELQPAPVTKSESDPSSLNEPKEASTNDNLLFPPADLSKSCVDKAISPLEKMIDNTYQMKIDDIPTFDDLPAENQTILREKPVSRKKNARPRSLSKKDMDTFQLHQVEQPWAQLESTCNLPRSDSLESATEEDFYRMYRSASAGNFLDSPMLSIKSTTTKPSKEPQQNLEEKESEKKDVIHRQVLLPKLVNSWLVWGVPENINSLAVTHMHIWYSDRSENLFYRQTDSMSGAWQKVDLAAQQIAVSRSGYIWWRLHQNTVYVGTGISSKKVEGKKQVEAIRDVTYIAVDEDCGWYIKLNGEIAVHKDLSRERPAYRSQKIPCEYDLIQLACLDRVVWGLTRDLQLVCRTGVSDQHPEGDEWCKYESPANCHVPEMMSIALGDNNTGWCVDTQGQVWFCTNVTREHPFGQGMWYQVAFSDYFMMDPTMTDMMRSVAERLDPQKLSQLLTSPRSGGLIAATHVGTWFVPSYKNVIQACKSIMQGHHWTITPPLGMAVSSSWKLVSAGAYTAEHEYIWAQHVNGEMVIFSPEARHFKMVPQPSFSNHFICISASHDSLWGLTANGTIYVRNAVRNCCPEGVNWVRLDLEQLGNIFFTHLSCGSDCVWAVDNNGDVYHKFGVLPPTDKLFTPVWLQVDPEPSGIIFTHVVAGPENWMVWAIDNKKQVYMREGISEKLSIGTKWCQITGTPANQLSISKLTVWALNPEGEILHRLGVSLANRGGDYWKKIPGVFTYLSASPSNELWAISKELQLYRHHTKFIYRKRQSSVSAATDLLDHSTLEDDWEIV